MKLSSIVLSAILVASVHQSYASSSVPQIVMQDLPLSNEVNARCQKTYAGYEFLQASDLDFSVSNDRYETRPMWPLLCSLSENSSRTQVTKQEYGVSVVYKMPDGKATRYDFVSTDENAFEIGAFNGNLMNNSNSQRALLDVMTALYNKVMGK